jgi:hypothetical protein
LKGFLVAGAGAGVGAGHLRLCATMAVRGGRRTSQTERTTRTRMRTRWGTLVRTRMRAVHRGALILAADRTRARARRQQHRSRDNRIRDKRHNRITTTTSRSSLPPTPLRRLLRLRLSYLCCGARTSRPVHLRPSLHHPLYLRPSGHARFLLPCRLPSCRPWLLPHLHHLLLPLLPAVQLRHFHVPLRASLMGSRGCRRLVSSSRPLLDFQVLGLVVHVM